MANSQNLPEPAGIPAWLTVTFPAWHSSEARTQAQVLVEEAAESVPPKHSEPKPL